MDFDERNTGHLQFFKGVWGLNVILNSQCFNTDPALFKIVKSCWKKLSLDDFFGP